MPARMSGDSTRSPRSRLRAADDRAVRVAERDVGAHQHELVGEDQAVLEHPLVDQDRALALRRERDGDRRQVGRERRPRAVLDLRLVLADVARGDQLLAAGDDHVVAVELGLQPELGEDQADHPQVAGVGVDDPQLAAGHAGERHERADLDVVGADRVRAAAELGLAGDGAGRWSRSRGCRRPSSRASARGPGRAARRRRCRSRSRRASARRPSARSRSPSPRARP